MDIISELNNKVSTSLVDYASEKLNENHDSSSKAVNASYATVLAGMIEKCKTESGTKAVYNRIKDADHDILDRAEAIFTRSPQTINGLLNVGNRDVPKFIGKPRESVNHIAEAAEIKKYSSSEMMKLSAPFLFGMLSKQVQDGDLDAGGLKGVLNGQKESVKRYLPQGVIDELQLSSFGYDPGKAERDAANAKAEQEELEKKKMAAKEEKLKLKAEKEERLAATRTVAPVEKPKGGGIGAAKWILPLLLIVGAVWLISKFGCNPVDKAASTVSTVTDKVVETTANVATTATDAVTTTFGNVNDAALKALGGITFAAGSVGDKMKTFISDGGNGEGRFRFNNLTFASGSSVIDGESGVEADNLAAILKAYPDVKIAIEGYTDSQGNAEANVNLSRERGEAVMRRLMDSGIDLGRMKVYGFGAANPVADNETPEGRAQNRRIEVLIQK